MIEKELTNDMIFDCKIWKFKSNKFAKLEVVIAQINVPIDILGHRYFDLLLLVPFDAVNLKEDDEGNKLDHKD